MFGQKDDNQGADNGSTDPMQAINEGAEQLLASEPATGTDAAAGPPAVASDTATPTDPAWQHPGAPLPADATNNTDSTRDVISPAGGYPVASSNRIGTDSDVDFPPDNTTVDEAAPAASNDAALVSNDDMTDAELIDIKQKALSELIPLIDKLDQPPQEKFRTIMMMIQASDDQRLVEKAYESAHAIEDEEARAQALLDIVNEINYFTQQPES